MKRFPLLICVTGLCISAIAQQRMKVFPPNDTHIEYMGRFDFSRPNEAVFMYSGSTIRAAFTGTSISVLLKDDSLRNWFTVTLDESLFNFKTDKPGGVYPLAQNLANKKHFVEISRRTEWHGGNTTFIGLGADSDATLYPLQRKQRLIEFIGDSYTCGYGNEGKSRQEHFAYETENNYASYCAVTARAVDAGYTAICRSGVGMYQGYGGDTSFTQPKLYDQVIQNSKVKSDYSKMQPHVVVIALGSNDFSVHLDSTQFVNSYIHFVAKIRHQYPAAKIICAGGPLGLGDTSNKFYTYLQAVTGSFKNIDKNAYFFMFSPFDPHGSDWHPNIIEHQAMASELIPFIKKITGW